MVPEVSWAVVLSGLIPLLAQVAPTSPQFICVRYIGADSEKEAVATVEMITTFTLRESSIYWLLTTTI